MNFPIPQFTPQVEPYCVWGKAFTPEECDSIIEICETLEFQKGRVGGDPNGGVIDDVRNSDITWLHPTHDNDWIHKRLSSLMSRINYDKFQVDLDCFDGFQYSKYGPDQHYGWHTDTIIAPPNAEQHRKLSMSLMLTDPADYEGGELLLAPNGDNQKATSIKRDKGDLVVFYSHTPHKVVPVTKGERVTLVSWALGPKLR
jgi:PKHD-type hydroxylase